MMRQNIILNLGVPILSLGTQIMSIVLSLSLMEFSQNKCYAITPEAQAVKSWDHLIENLNYPSAPFGTIIASPSTNAPNYLYHWIRDAGVVTREIINLYNSTKDPILKSDINEFMKSWIEIENQHQIIAESQSLYDYGEPLFTLAGEIYPESWGRPQYDGPAIRALAMIEWAKILISENRYEELKKLYAVELPPHSIIKKDLEFVAHNWTKQGFDVWEEVNAHHFFSLMAQRAALIQGANLAHQLNDPNASDYYLKQVSQIEVLIRNFYDEKSGYLKSSINQIGGWRHKLTNLDVAPILASIYFSQNDGFMTPESKPIVNTALKLIETFKNLYEINRNSKDAPAIGRYPEDVYSGSGFLEGNPWFLTTFGIAEWACAFKQSEKFIQLDNVSFNGMDFILRSLKYTDEQGRLSEQFSRHDGKQMSAVDLSWSYSSYIRAFRICNSNIAVIPPSIKFRQGSSSNE